MVRQLLRESLSGHAANRYGHINLGSDSAYLLRNGEQVVVQCHDFNIVLLERLPESILLLPVGHIGDVAVELLRSVTVVALVNQPAAEAEND